MSIRFEAIVRRNPFITIVIVQALNTLEHMLEMGIPGVCDKWLTLPPNPDIVDIDLLYEAGAGAKRLDISSVSEKARTGAHTGIVLKKTKSYDYASTESPNESLDDTVSLSINFQLCC